jgi:hypothetical protein
VSEGLPTIDASLGVGILSRDEIFLTRAGSGVGGAICVSGGQEVFNQGGTGAAVAGGAKTWATLFDARG